MKSVARVGVIAAFALMAACGHKGPPLAPLHLVPAAPAGTAIRRAGEDAQLRFQLPTANANGPGPVALDRVEIYAVTVAPGANPPPNRELMTAKFRVGSIDVKPPPVEGEPPPPAPAEPDPRPSPGDKATFVETLTDEKLKPVTTVVKGDPAAATAGAVATIVAAVGKSRVAVPLLALASLADPVAGAALVVTTGAAAAGAAIPPYPVRIYAIRGLTGSGRPGPPAARLELPIVALPAAPLAPAATVTETAITIGWTAAEGIPAAGTPAAGTPAAGTPATETPAAGTPAAGTPAAGTSVPTFNVYAKDGTDPLNSAPIAGTQYERGGVSFGKEECFVVRSVLRVGTADVESEPVPICVTPRDTFPPAEPKGLSVVAGDGTIKLSWDANADQDLAGYMVLRGEAPGETLQPLASAPLSGTSFEDKTVKAGVRYVYAIVAVDKATPPNKSGPSPRVEETAR